MPHRPFARIVAILSFALALLPALALALAQVAPAAPVFGTVMTPEYARIVAKQAYVWGCPHPQTISR